MCRCLVESASFFTLPLVLLLNRFLPFFSAPEHLNLSPVITQCFVSILATASSPKKPEIVNKIIIATRQCQEQLAFGCHSPLAEAVGDLRYTSLCLCT